MRQNYWARGTRGKKFNNSLRPTEEDVKNRIWLCPTSRHSGVISSPISLNGYSKKRKEEIQKITLEAMEDG